MAADMVLWPSFFNQRRCFKAFEISVASTSTPSTRRAPTAATRKLMKPT